MIGSLAPEVEQMYGEIFAKYLADPQNLFVISSDFCHWGSRFRYTHYDKSAGPIWKSIEKLDKNVNLNMHDEIELLCNLF
jgi:predicted class III extradiol MEMO1 family dioxygenase